MAKITNQQGPTVMVAPKQAPIVDAKAPINDRVFLFGKKNFMLMLVGLAVIAIGFALMSGGKSPDPHVFDYKEIYSFRRITLAPIVVLLGFVIEGIAIMWIPKEEQ